ncbi:MAG: L-histidine N(alpha)-methyltransferase [Gemmatimonadaceae bacterium]|nr:L-histidine N(alpha)-methyltransferase [Gemmatimonadaceae bacterium]
MIASSLSARPEIIRGLWATPKTLPPKLFYDEIGAALFERICTLDEYYLTRAELEILTSHASTIADLAGPRCGLIEYGSGAGTKVRLLLDVLDEPAAYAPVDISADQLARIAREIAAEYPGLSVRPLVADYTGPLLVPPLPEGTRPLVFFPGSTIGNFDPHEAAAFLRRAGITVGSEGAMLLGVDRRKDARVLEAAYNDASGVTAAFNLNVLARLNREFGSDFDLQRFRHNALWNDQASRIEMHLESLEAQTVRVADEPVHFAKGETIWTESSYKYDRSGLEELVRRGGFELARLWTDSEERFWVCWLTPSKLRA